MHKIRTLLILLSFLANAETSAAILVDSGQPATNTSGLVVGAFSPTHGQNVAVKFSLSQAAMIDGFSALMYGSGGALTFALLASNSTGDPGSELFATTLTPIVGSFGNPAWFGPSNMSLSLAAGTYWAAFEDKPGQNFLGGIVNTASTLSQVKTADIGGPWLSGYLSQGLGFQVYGVLQAVPEPPALYMILLGLSVFGFASLRNSQV
jgi:hypothetical protein